MRWRRDVRMKICMLYRKQKKVRRSCTDLLGRETGGKDAKRIRVLKDEYGNMMVGSEAVLKK